MKKFPLVLIILLFFLLTSCDKILNPDTKEAEKYYVSVRIVDLSTSTPIALAGHLVGIKVGDKSLTSGYTDSNGWFTSAWELNKSDFVTLTIFNKTLDKSVKIEAFSPANHPEMFVKNKNDFKTNIPSVGYHIYTNGLNNWIFN